MTQPIQCTEEDLQELKRLALAVRANSDDDDALGVALDEYDEHANPDQVLCLFEAIDRVTAERDALQVLLTTADEKNDTLAMAYLRANDREHELRKEIVLLRAALKFYADSDHYSTDDGLNWDSCSGEPANILWHESEPWFVEDGSIARAALAHSVEAADQEEVQQCQFPQACPSNCGCDIPDFTPGNGNKARRRAAAIEALKPENQRITPIDHGTKAGFCDCNQGRFLRLQPGPLALHLQGQCLRRLRQRRRLNTKPR